jgi:hypothetical protein
MKQFIEQFVGIPENTNSTNILRRSMTTLLTSHYALHYTPDITEGKQKNNHPLMNNHALVKSAPFFIFLFFSSFEGEISFVDLNTIGI